MVRRTSRLLQTAIALGFATCLTLSPIAHAAPLLGITASASMTFDSGFAAGELSGSGTQSGAMRFNGSPDSSYSGASVTGANPLAGGFSATGQGFGFGGSASASGNGTFGVGIDYAFNFLNTSATNAYRVVIGLAYSNQVNSSGANAYASSEFVVKNGPAELFFTDLMSDALNGNEIAGVLVGGGPGGPLTDIGSTSLVIDLAANASLDLDGFWTLRGGAFDAGSNADSFFDVFFTIDDVILLGQPPTPVPAPGTLALLLLGLAGLAASKSRRRVPATERRFA